MLWIEIPEYNDYLISSNKKVVNKNIGKVMSPFPVGYKTHLKLFNNSGERKHICVETVFNELYPFHWFNQLADDEIVKPLIFDGIPEGKYYITSYGRIFNTRDYKFLKLTKNRKYYAHAVLQQNHHRQTIHIHIAVGRMFLPDYKPGLLILHKDETLPFDEVNRVSNLWAGTHKENTQDMLRKGRQRKPRSKI